MTRLKQYNDKQKTAKGKAICFADQKFFFFFFFFFKKKVEAKDKFGHDIMVF